MHGSQYLLLTRRRFLPIFLTQFLGAFNDNLLRSGLVVLIAYSAQRGIELPLKPEVMVTICSALLVVPFLLFSAIAGPLADKYEKSRLVQITKAAEVGIMAVAMYGFATENIYLLMVMLFISGTHSTFFGPMKYSILPDHLRDSELLAGNGLIAGGSYLAILLGLICGGLLVEMEGNLIGIAAVGVACAGLIASLCIPPSTPASPHMHISLNLWRGTANIVRYAYQSRPLFLSILGLSWFLLVGSVFMAQFPNYAQAVVRGNNEVYTLFLTVFSIGIAAGSVLCDRLLRGEISARYTPMAALGVSVFTLVMLWATPPPSHGGLLDVHAFLTSDPRHLLVLAMMLLVAICGGIYMVPLYAILQSRSEAGYRSRVIAASNIFDSLFMTSAAIISTILLSLGMSVTGLFLALAVANLAVAAFIFSVLPETLLRTAVRWTLMLLYRVEVRGDEHYRAAGPRTVIVAGHAGFFEALLLAAFLPDRPLFAVESSQLACWRSGLSRRLLRILCIDRERPATLRPLLRHLRRGGRIVAFAEPGLDANNGVTYSTFGWMAEKARLTILPVRIDGGLKKTVTFLPPQQVQPPEAVDHRERRHVFGRNLYQLVSETLYPLP